jgi:predicted DNA-binding transcriptional regulator AlpA
MIMTELCEIMMISRQTVDKRIRACKMPKPVDRGRERLFDRAEIYRFLNVDTDARILSLKRTHGNVVLE